jgi:hypothetical protein
MSKRPKKPVLEKKGKTANQQSWHICIWEHPLLKGKFSYAIAINDRLLTNPYPITESAPSLFGTFSTPHEALTTAIDTVGELNNLPQTVRIAG